MEFGTSGMLYRSNKLMYDRGTNTLWRQFLGEPAVGPLVGSGIKLELIPSVVNTWADWLALHPDTTVLALDTGVFPPTSYLPEDDRRSIYFRYRNTPDTMFPVFRRSGLLPTKSQVLGLRLNGRVRAYPLQALADQRVVNDALAGQSLVIVAADQGVGARAYQSGPHRFTLASAGQKDGETGLTDEQGRRWRVQEDALVLAANPAERLPRLAGRISYWFGWLAFNPDTQVYGGPDGAP